MTTNRRRRKHFISDETFIPISGLNFKIALERGYSYRVLVENKDGFWIIVPRNNRKWDVFITMQESKRGRIEIK